MLRRMVLRCQQHEALLECSRVSFPSVSLLKKEPLPGRRPCCLRVPVGDVVTLSHFKQLKMSQRSWKRRKWSDCWSEGRSHWAQFWRPETGTTELEPPPTRAVGTRMDPEASGALIPLQVSRCSVTPWWSRVRSCWFNPVQQDFPAD